MKFEKNIKKWSILIFLFWALFISIPFWTFGSSSYVRIHDSADGRLATRLALNVNREEGEVGYWNPDMFAGGDRLAEGNSLELINILFYFLPGWLSYAIFMIAQRFVAGYFTFRLINDHLNVRSWLAMLPAFYYALFPMQTYNNQFEGFAVPNAFTLSIIPFLLWSMVIIGKNFDKNILKNVIYVFGLGLLLAATSNFAFSIFIYPVIVFILLFIFDQDIIKVIKLITIFIIGWFLIEHQEMIAAYLHSASSNRTLKPYCVSNPAKVARTLRTLFLEASYAPYLLFSFASLVFYNKKKIDRMAIVLAILVSGLILSSVFMPILMCSELISLDFLSGFSFSRFSLFVPFSTMLFYGISLEKGLIFLENIIIGPELKRKILYIPILIAMALFVATLSSASTSLDKMLALRSEGNNYQNIFENPYLEYLATLMEDEGDPSRRVVMLDPGYQVSIHPGYLWPYGINTLDGYTVIYQLRFHEYWTMVIDPMMSNYPECRYGIKLSIGYNRAYLSTHCEVEVLEDDFIVDDWFDTKLLYLAGVKYIVSQRSISDPGLTKIDTSDIVCDFDCTKYQIYMSENVSGFLKPYAEYQIVSTDKEATNAMMSASREELDKFAVLVSGDLPEILFEEVSSSNFEYQILKYSADRIIVDIKTDTPKIVQINIAYSPYWRAYNGQTRIDIFPVNQLFIGIYVPEGSSTIILKYEPPYSVNKWIN